MTVKELIEKLKKFDEDKLVYNDSTGKEVEILKKSKDLNFIIVIK